MRVVLALMVMIALFGCEPDTISFYNGPGKVPVYANESELLDIKNLGRQNALESGPIFLNNSTLFITELSKGIHVYNVEDSTNVIYITFIKIPAITDFTISGDRLYADSWKDLLTIDISDILDIKLVSRQQDVYQPILAPRLYRGFFECIDLKKGAVIDWRDTILVDAKCNAI